MKDGRISGRRQKRGRGRPRKLAVPLQRCHHICERQDQVPVSVNLLESKLIKRHYTEKQKRRVVDYARHHGINPAARHSSMPRKNIHRWMKEYAAVNYDYTKVSKDRHGKKNRKGQGRKLSYRITIDEKILEWVLFQCESHLAVSSQLLQDKAKLLVKPHNPAFSGSEGWLRRFMRQHILVLRASTSVAKKLPRDLECKIEEFKQEMKFIQLISLLPSTACRQHGRNTHVI